MYDFKREGFPGFPLGQKIEFYGQKQGRLLQVGMRYYYVLSLQERDDYEVYGCSCLCPADR